MPFFQQKCVVCEQENKVQKLEEEEDPSAEVKKLQRKPIFESNTEPPDEGSQRKYTESRKEERLQKKEGNTGSQNAEPHIESSLNSSKGSGHPLPENTRQKMESSMGADFSNVRIHNDSDAARMSKDLNAQAFTHGNDIYFNSGKYDTSSRDGQHLLAHELTHTVQQSGGSTTPVMEKIQKKGKDEKTDFAKATPEDLKEVGDKCTVGFISKKSTRSRKQFHIKKLKPHKYHLSEDAVNHFRNHRPSKIPKSGTRDTKQDSMWKKNVRAGARENLLEVGELKQGESFNTGTLLRLKPKNSRSSYKGIVGTFTQIVNEVLIPNWDYKGGPNIYQVEHMVDWQILGENADDMTNFILLDAGENLRVAKVVENAITKALEGIAKHYAKTFKNVPQSAKVIKSKFDSYVDDLDGAGKELKKTDFYYSKAFTDTKDERNPYKDDLIIVKEEEIPDGYFLLTSSDKRASYLIPHHANGTKVGAFKVTVEYAGGKVKSISFENRFTGKSTEVGVDKSLKKKKVEIKKETKDKYIVQDGDEKAIISPMLKSLSLTKFSPVQIDEKDIIIEGFDVRVKGKVNSTLSFLQGVDIFFSFENGDFNVKAVIPLDKIGKNVPKPFKVDYCNIEIGGGTNTSLYILGGLGFSIEKLGNGEIFAKLSNSLSLDGRFNFDSKYFDPAEINVAYEKGKWEIGGHIGIKEGIVKGVKKASLKAAYKEGVFTVDGDAELSIPGIDKIKLHADFAENGDFTFIADVELKKLPGIKSGSAKVTITSKGVAGLKLGLAGEAVPDLPNVPGLSDLKLTISYLDGVFELRAKVGYKKGRFDGTIEVGVTNKKVDEKGQPQGEAQEKGDVSVFGYGSLTVDIYKGINGTVSIRLTPEREVLIGGIIKAKELKPFGEGFYYDKEILSFPELEIPLVGIPGMSVSAFIKGGVHFKFLWLPLVLKELSLDFKETNINELERASLEIIGSVGSGAHAEVYLFIQAGLKARVLVATLEGSLGGEAGLGVDAEAGGKVDATWDMDKGLKFKEIRAYLDVIPKAIFRLTGQVSVDLDLWITSVNLYYHQWVLAEKQLDLSGITLKLDFPIRFKETGEVELPTYESMNIVKPDFTGDSGKRILDDAINGDAKKEEQKKKEELKQKIHDDLRSADNKDVTPTEYTEKMMDKYEKSPELQAFVKTTIEDESRKLEYEHFEEEKSMIRNANIPLANKFSLLNMFTMFHAYVTRADVEAFKAELTKIEEDRIKAAASAAQTGGAQGPDNKPVNDIPGPPNETPPPLNNNGSTVRKKEMPGAAIRSDMQDKTVTQRKPVFESEKEEVLSAKAEKEQDAENGGDNFYDNLNAAKGSGNPLPHPVRDQMETRIGADFSKVRIHNDFESHHLSKLINAQAFTHGNDIFFNTGKYDTTTEQGQRLLAHELIHTLQQGASETKNEKYPRLKTIHAKFLQLQREVNELQNMNAAANLHKSDLDVQMFEMPSFASLTGIAKYFNIDLPDNPIDATEKVLNVLQNPYVRPALSILPGFDSLIMTLQVTLKMYRFIEYVIKNKEKIIGEIKAYIEKKLDQVEPALKEKLRSAFGPVDHRHFVAVWEAHLLPMLKHLKDNWWETIKDTLWEQIWPFEGLTSITAINPADSTGLGKDLLDIKDHFEQGWDEMKKMNFSKFLDQSMLVSKGLTGVINRFYGWAAIIIVASETLAGAGIAGVFSGGTLSGAGAAAGFGAGLATAGSIGEALLIATVAIDASILVKSILSLNDFDSMLVSEEILRENNEYYKQIAQTSISLTLTGLLFALAYLGGKIAEALLSKLVKFLPASLQEVLQNIRRGMLGEKPGTVSDESLKVEKNPPELNAEYNQLREGVKNPENIKEISDPELIKDYDVEVKAGDHIYRRNKVNGSWCRFSDAICGFKLDDVNAAVDKALKINGPKELAVGESLSVPYKKGIARAEVIGIDDQFVKIKIKSKSASGDVTQSMRIEDFNNLLKDGKIIRWTQERETLMNNRPKYDDGLVEKVWETAKNGEGKVLDPHTKEELTWDKSKSRLDQWHMGHKPGKEYVKLVDEFVEGKITYEEFIKEYNNPENYWPESPEENISHKHEVKPVQKKILITGSYLQRVPAENRADNYYQLVNDGYFRRSINFFYDQLYLEHKPGLEFAKLVDEYVDGKINFEEFLRKFNDLSCYWGEDTIESFSDKDEENNKRNDKGT